MSDISNVDSVASGLRFLSLGEDETDNVQAHQKKALVTSALPYVNNVPHLGNIIGSTLSADVFARFCRLRNRPTLYICGTDEYGTATEFKALQEKVTPEEICRKYHELHSNVYKWFNISFDHFGRTSTPQQTELCQDIFWKLHKRDLIQEQTIEQLFCNTCNIFLADRFVEGICPFCSDPDARGDQCDKCGKLINAPDLKEPKCKMCKSTPRIQSSKHLFLDLPKLQPEIESWLAKTFAKETCNWTHTSRAIAESWLKEGLKPRCITRDLKWGTPVPLPGFENKVFYVWFDAPIGYLSITKCLVGDDWDKWWKNPDEVELYQFMAKDNVPFHSIIMPATQLGTGENWTLVNQLMAIDYLNYEDQKFSKSRGIGIFGNDVMDTKISSDIYRFYLLSVRPETGDSSFSWSDLMARNNSELLNNVGNFCNRALTFLYNNFGGVVQPIALNGRDQSLVSSVNQELQSFIDLMSKGKLRDGLKQLLKISGLGNVYMQETKPWELVKDSETKVRAGSVISLSANLVALLSLLFSPFIPDACETLRKQLNFTRTEFSGHKMTALLKEGHQIDKPSPLFRKIEESEIKDYKTRFGGKSSETSSSFVPPDVSGKSASDLEALIKEQGDKVRSLKAGKAAKDAIDAEVQLLKFLKQALVKSA